MKKRKVLKPSKHNIVLDFLPQNGTALTTLYMLNVIPNQA